MAEPLEIEYPTRLIEAQSPVIQKSRDAALKKYADEIAAKTAGFDTTAPPEVWRYASRRLPLREALLGLTQSAISEESLAQCLQWLKQLQRRGQLTTATFKLAEDLRTSIIIHHWFPPLEYRRLILYGYCFYSDKATAKSVLFRCRKWRTRLGDAEDDRFIKGVEQDVIRKIRKKYGLVSARPLTIRDVCWKDGEVELIPFKSVIRHRD